MSTVTAGPSHPVAGQIAASTDDVLVAALRARDERAYLELVRRYTPLMLHVARTVVAQREVAEDVVQDTWVAVLRNIDGFEGRSAFKTWLMRVLVNTARKRRLREARTVSWSCQAGDAPSGTSCSRPDPGRATPRWSTPSPGRPGHASARR